MKRLDEIEQLIRSVLQGGELLLIVPPFTTIETGPVLGPHLLQTCAEKAGFKTEILYLNVLLAAIIGLEMEENLSGSPLLISWRLLGERLFARSAYGLPRLGRMPESCTDEAQSISGASPHRQMCYETEPFDLAPYWPLEECCTAFAAAVIPVLAAFNYKLIGCTAKVGQTNCSVALLNGVKQLLPECLTLIGGASCEGEMAAGVASLTPSIDYIFSGESEVAFGDFLARYARGALPAGRIITGEPLRDLDSLPLPAYDSFADQLQKFLGAAAPKKWGLTYETSRGCWWGEKQKCRFCGQYPGRLKFRQKTAAKVLRDLEQISVRYPQRIVFMCDNIMPLAFHKELLPALQKKADAPMIFYMQKANLTLNDVIQLKNARVTQTITGIESLASSLLQLMHKGVAGKDNLLLLRNAHAVGIYVTWFLLWGLPGDQLRPYEEMLALLPLLRHLQPPAALTPMYLERFSAYWENPPAYHITNLRPWAAYHTIYPEGADIRKLAFYFIADYPSEAYAQPDVIQKLAAAVRAWKDCWGKVHLVMTPLQDNYFIYDSRGLHSTSQTHLVNHAEARELMTSGVYQETDVLRWALAEKLGVVHDGWYVPLVTAAPELLLTFEAEARE